MILLTILLITLLLLGIIVVLGVSALGAGTIIIFGDVIVCMIFIALLIKLIFKKRKK